MVFLSCFEPTYYSRHLLAAAVLARTIMWSRTATFTSCSCLTSLLRPTPAPAPAPIIPIVTTSVTSRPSRALRQACCSHIQPGKAKKRGTKKGPSRPSICRQVILVRAVLDRISREYLTEPDYFYHSHITHLYARLFDFISVVFIKIHIHTVRLIDRFLLKISDHLHVEYYSFSRSHYF